MLTLPIVDALLFCEDLRAIGKGIIGLECWYRHGDDGWAEYPWSPDYSRFIGQSDFARISIAKAEDYIKRDLPEHVTHIGFVL